MEVDGQEDSEIPSAKDCLDMCETFAEFTETDKAMAMFFLQDHSWNLEKALERFYRNREDAMTPVCGRRKSRASECVIDLVSDTEDDVVSVDPQHASFFRVISWNIDGLSTKSRGFRTAEVLAIIKRERFHVVCLQEVVRESLAYLKLEMGAMYSIFHPDDIATRDYFPAICVLNQQAISHDPQSFEVIRFRGSVMQRVLLGLDVMIDVAHFFPDKAALFCRPLRLRVWTSHLESCANFAEERKRQLQQSWQLMLLALEGTEPGANRADCSIFCGDMNVRDSEIRQLGGVPGGIVDVWQVCGARREARATWDPSRNPNLALDNPEGSGGAFSSSSSRGNRKIYGMRFDRMYATNVNSEHGLRPVDFELRGLERVPGRSHFPSDHWAILGHFELI